MGEEATEMPAGHQVTLGSAMGTAIGTALLADTPRWATRAVVRSSLAIVLGPAIVIDDVPRGEPHDGAVPTSPGGA